MILRGYAGLGRSVEDMYSPREVATESHYVEDPETAYERRVKASMSTGEIERVMETMPVERLVQRTPTTPPIPPPPRMALTTADIIAMERAEMAPVRTVQATQDYERLVRTSDAAAPERATSREDAMVSDIQRNMENQRLAMLEEGSRLVSTNPYEDLPAVRTVTDVEAMERIAAKNEATAKAAADAAAKAAADAAAKAAADAAAKAAADAYQAKKTAAALAKQGAQWAAQQAAQVAAAKQAAAQQAADTAAAAQQAAAFMAPATGTSTLPLLAGAAALALLMLKR